MRHSRATATKNGLAIAAGIDTNSYEKGIETPNKQFHDINIKRHGFRGDWNHTIHPSAAP